MINKKPNEQQNIVIRILKKLEIIKIILGIKNTFKVFSQINNWKTFHPTKENMIITNFTLENRKYEIVTNKYDLRSYLIKDGKQITGMNNVPNSFHSNILNLTNNTRFTVTEYDFEFYENTIYNYCSNMDFPMLVIRYMFVPRDNITPVSKSLKENRQKFLKF